MAMVKAKPKKLKYTVQFMREVVRTNKSTGALGPSSMALAEVVTDLARVHESKVIVEYGPGTGVFTEVIARKMRPDARFYAVEVNPEFVKTTRERCPNVRVVQASAQETARILREDGLEHCDTIVSGLPWTRFPEELQDEILEATYNVLAPGGRFVTFAYAFSPVFPSGKRFFNGKLRKRFPMVRRTPQIWKNFPPCHVYIAEKV